MRAQLGRTNQGLDWLRHRPQDGALRSRIEEWEALALAPGRARKCPPELLDDLDIAAFDYVGDPLAENLLLEIYAAGLRDTDVMEALALLVDAGNQAALDFRATVEHVPDFLDFDKMRPGSAFTRRNLLGAALAIHVALPFSYSDEKVARVLAGSGRLNDMQDFERRLWETASGFLSVLDVDSLAPGGDSWEKWVRIRLMHTKVRMGVSRSGTWDYTNGGPISSLGTAAGVYLFGEFRANLILGMGGRGTQAELAACIRTWQWVATILGSPPELIGHSIAEQRFLDVKIGTRVLAPGENSRLLTRSALNGVSTMMFARRIPTPLHEALGRYAMKVALRDSPLEREGINLTDELGYPVHPVLDKIVGVVVAVNRLASQSFRIPIVADSAATVFGKLINRVLERGLAGQAPDFTTPMH